MNQLRLSREECLLTAIALLAVGFLNALVVARYAPVLTTTTENYHQLVLDTVHISGFDSWTYSILTHWNGWELRAIRHPLLSVMLFLPYLLNQGLIALTGVNCAIYIMAVIETCAGVGSLLLFWRILRGVVGVRRMDAALLTALFFSFAYIMLSMMVPDHFGLSLLMLLLTLYILGLNLRSGRLMTVRQTVALFLLTAGISLNNGTKVFLAALFNNGRRFFRRRYLLTAVILPSVALVVIAMGEYKLWGEPEDLKFERAMALKQQHYRDSVRADYIMRHPGADSAQIARGYKMTMQRLAHEAYRRNHANPKAGQPISKTGVLVWTDKTTNRWESIKENFFGESLQLHKPHALEDLMVQGRPMMTSYEVDYHYWIEALIVALFVAGIFFARRSRLFWAAFSWFIVDAALFLGFGFAIGECYIMTAGWAFVIPLAMAYMLRDARPWLRLGARFVTALLALYLLCYNGSIIVEKMTAGTLA